MKPIPTTRNQKIAVTLLIIFSATYGVWWIFRLFKLGEDIVAKRSFSFQKCQICTQWHVNHLRGEVGSLAKFMSKCEILWRSSVKKLVDSRPRENDCFSTIFKQCCLQVGLLETIEHSNSSNRQANVLSTFYSNSYRSHLFRVVLFLCLWGIPLKQPASLATSCIMLQEIPYLAAGAHPSMRSFAFLGHSLSTLKSDLNLQTAF